MLYGVIALAVFSSLLSVVLSVLLLRRGRSESEPNLSAELQKEFGNLRVSLASQMLEMSQQVNLQLAQNTKFLQSSHGDYREAVGEVNKQLGTLHESAQSMMAVGKDIASLHNILKSPKLRGGLGELFLEEVLRQILPQEHYQTQYSFKSGTTVDAIIYLGDGMIPVDSKFPYENFKKLQTAEDNLERKKHRKLFLSDVKKHIDSIAEKYILPHEGTFDFALLYIPAENIYYETIIKDDFELESLSRYALEKKVIPVSPNSFYAYLQMIVRGLKGLRIERSAKKILEGLGQLEADMKRFEDDFEKLGSHLSHATSSFDKTEKHVEKLRLKIETFDQVADDANQLEDGVRGV